MFWHNCDKPYAGKTTPAMYHYSKSIECSKLGIRLVHIFEDEWANNPKLCKSKLRKILCPQSIRHIDAH